MVENHGFIGMSSITVFNTSTVFIELKYNLQKYCLNSAIPMVKVVQKLVFRKSFSSLQGLV